jgi:hypothetical protein
MKAAIYSRVMEEEQQKDFQLFFDELAAQKIEPVIFRPFFQQVKEKLDLPSGTESFAESADLSDEIEFIISLGGDGTLLIHNIGGTNMSLSWASTLAAGLSDINGKNKNGCEGHCQANLCGGQKNHDTCGCQHTTVWGYTLCPQ